MKQQKNIKKIKVSIITICIACLFFVYTGHAEEKNKAELKTNIKTLPSITVTEKGLEKTWGKQFTTNVISPDDKVQAGQTMDISDLLKESQSVFIQNSSYGKKVFLRGMEDQDMRILINGMPAGQMGKYYTRSFEWETIPVEAIERIEVTKGAGSAEYGNTIAGTINII
ncbi:MAG: Plug domain-containing protein, partial [Desulfosarcina sp.]|nr:Plug domain-containing protein [Desulfobacterales bacterium]